MERAKDLNIAQSKRYKTPILSEFFLILTSLVFFYPVLFMIMASLRTRMDFASSPIAFPKTFTLANLFEAFTKMDFLRVFANSIIVTGISLIIIMTIGSMAAYPLSRIKNKTANGLYLFFTAGMIIPLQISMVPLYKLMVDLKLLNNLLSCILVYCGAWMTSTVFIYVGFMTTIPKEFDEAAYVDGASKLYAFWKIIFPLLKPINATIAVIVVIGIWNDFLLPLLYLQKAASRTVQIGLYAFSGIYGTDWTNMFSAMVLTTGPIVLFYIILQKYIVKGIIDGAVKG